jgi:hypothetical protein
MKRIPPLATTLSAGFAKGPVTACFSDHSASGDRRRTRVVAHRKPADKSPGDAALRRSRVACLPREMLPCGVEATGRSHCAGRPAPRGGGRKVVSGPLGRRGSMSCTASTRRLTRLPPRMMSSPLPSSRNAKPLRTCGDERDRRAPLRCGIGGRVKPVSGVRGQIARASSVNAAATRRAGGASTASS